MKIKHFIQGKGLKQLQISKETGICPSSLNRFLNGWQELSEIQVERLAKNLKLTVEEIVGNEVKDSRRKEGFHGEK